ncbi:laminin subunit alpha-1 [Halyomorpha halys]|uniref:laminin subunit alpha-1 n=1 Tax=Halyomorpha halys TaxID=286706 RepID=UPI0034D33547
MAESLLLGGLYPEPVNLAQGTRVWANATCGQDGPEAFCRLRGRHCGVCDSRSPDKRHPPQNAVDGRADTWWQSPALNKGLHYEAVTFTVDLGQVYQVLHVRLRVGTSPRPGSWILERALEDEEYRPWTYFAPTTEECEARYGAQPPHCLSNMSRVTPMDGGEVHVSLSHVYNNVSNAEFLKLTKARYIQFRFQKMNSQKLEKARHGSDMAKRFYYTIRDILIQGRCICHGHASKCSISDDKIGICECSHNTEGPSCERCLPLYNQEKWRSGTPKEANPCQKCQCHGHGVSCLYDAEVSEAGLSLDSKGRFSGGGVCNCTNHTSGINCEKCDVGWYRPSGVRPDAPIPCIPCDCKSPGSTGYCIKDNSEEHLGKIAGTCECQEGFTGPKCDRCAPGYKDFPSCDPCTCDSRGMLPGTSCHSQCFCKVNVEGKLCDKCREGHYFLDRDNPDGCTECYCSHVTNVCTSAVGYKPKEVLEMKGWKVTDLSTSYIVEPYNPDPDAATISVADNQMPDIENYYWMAPHVYRGNKLTSYGSTVTFTVSWDVLRGDTSGKATTGPDLVLIGHNGLKIGYGNTWHKSKNMSITVQLTPDGWYHIVEDTKDVIARSRRNHEPWEEYRGDNVNRHQLLSVLADIKHFLVRAKFHTDQVEGSLDSCVLEMGVEGSTGADLNILEKCECPEGYKGLSCESCDYGYARITHEGTMLRHHPICTKCNCNGHSQTCDAITGQCGTCEHNTTGVQCERCIDGFYGDPSKGTPNDCRKCHCPLVQASNNFSPTCEADNLGYICTKCPVGYTGRHCEKCDAGYFGNPEELGSKCEPCNCNNGPCDHLTGQCLTCHGNTEGGKCDRCKPFHYGSPNTTGCFPCECSITGGEEGEACDIVTGQCKCKERFTGRACDRCETGLGNVSAGCLPCACNKIGAISSICDPVTGICTCHPGVSGLLCDTCLPQHYGYSSTGCTSCSCHNLGSRSLDCDSLTGECSCRDHVVGRTCSICENGYWGLSSAGCVKCECDILGSKEHGCDQETGQCYCKPGVGGLKCNQCLPRFYNMSSEGCSECDACDLPGHVCDPDTGACVCPPYTTGLACEECLQHTWGFHPQNGCKPCDCDKHGSYDGKCDPLTGNCHCREGYKGPKCQACSRGYYGFPVCQKCGCDVTGTKSRYCFEGLCDCDNTGQCPCKENTVGLHCASCKDGTFGMNYDDPNGCTECFCFGRSTKCSDAGLTWSLIRIPRPRTLMIRYDNDSSFTGNIYPVNTQEICYINLAMPGNGGIVKKDDKQLNITNNLRIIPSDDGDVELGVNYFFDAPVYWQLPDNFLGDKVLSYGGYLRFCVDTKGEHTLFPSTVLLTYPLIQIQGNDKLILEHFPLLPNPTKCHQVRLQESLWKVKNNPQDKVSREMLMVTLQNIQHILIRASDSIDFTEASLRDVSLDSGTPSRTKVSNPAHGLELCDCPVNYNSSSCQDPSLGFYRSKIPMVTSTIIIQLVGEAKPCECNGRSSVCDIETGHCRDCSHNTAGFNCEFCAEGYYGDPQEGKDCLPCPCPSSEQNFAKNCIVDPNEDPICICKEGYTGPLCNRCSPGWYGHPTAIGGKCQPCTCNEFGSLSDECDEETGSCTCKANVTSRDCSQCVFPRHVLVDHSGCSECSDPCVTLLLDTVSNLSKSLEYNTYNIITGALAPPRETLMSFRTHFSDLNSTWFTNKENLLVSEALNNNVESEFRMKLKHLQNKVKKAKKKGETSLDSAIELKVITDDMKREVEATKEEVYDTIDRLLTYAEGDKEQISTSAMLHEAKQVLARVLDTDLEANKMRGSEVLRLCNNTLNDLHYILGERNEVRQLADKLEDLLMKMDDFDRLADETLKKRDRIVELNRDNKNKTEILRNNFREIENAYNEANKVLNKTNYMNEVTKVNIQEADDNLEAIKTLKNDLHHSTRLIEKRANILRHNNELYYEQYVGLARQRADDLMNTTEKYVGMFKKDTGSAIKASTAYQDIIDAINEALDAAKNASLAADVAYEKAYPGVGTDSLFDQSKSSREISNELSIRAQDQLDRVYALPPDLYQYTESFTKLEEKIKNVTNDDNYINKQINELLNQLSSVKNSSLETIINCDNTLITTEEIMDSVSFLSHNISTDLRARVKQLENDGEISLNTGDIIDEVQSNIKKAHDMVKKMTFGLNEQTKLFSEWNDTISDKLETLRNKITQAHHVTNGIRLSMTSIGDTGGSCVRTYEPEHLEPSTMTSVVLTYAISSQLRDALLFYLPSSTTNDFIAIEMVNRKIRFVWNVGGGMGEVTHPHHIQTAGDLSKDQHWYKVEAERVSNIGHLRVRPVVVPEGSVLANMSFATNSSTPGIGRLDVAPGDRVWVGGADRRHPHLLSTQTGLVGCLHHLYLNDRPIGLWDFTTQNPNSCTACVEGAEERKDISSFTFLGDGYAVLHHDSASAYNKYIFSVSLSFKTYDSNALLFIGIGPEQERFISLTLKDGRLVFRINYGIESTLEMSSFEKYNTGNWTRVEASRYFDRKKKLEKGVLKVGKEKRDGAPTPPPSQDMIPDMSSANYYVGGLPPDIKLKVNVPGPFLGCMKDLQIDQGEYSLLKGQNWGIQASCSKKPITVAGFQGQGYVELPSHTLKKKDNFGFVFSTSQRDALLMLSTFEGLSGPLDDKEEMTNLIEQEDRLSYFSVSLLRGQIDVRLNAGKGEVRLASISSEYSDSRFHTVSVVKNGRRLELRVDDSLDSTTTLPEGAVTLKAPGELGGLYFGGLPQGFNSTGRTFSNIPFIGTIKDIIFNEKIFGFDHPINFEGVTIGRFGPGGSDPEGLLSRSSIGCRKVTSYTLEPGAVKFGDNPNSYVELNFRRRAILQKNFTLELDFRTFYPNGLIFMIPGVKGKQPHYLMAALRNGRVQIVLKGRRKIETTAHAVFNDGVWHKMILEKEDRRMTLKVDSIDPEKTKTPKKMNVGHIIYIGGLPESGVMIPQPLLNKLEGFKGCIRGLKVNNHEEYLLSEKSTPPYRVGQCIPQVERGSYFPGDAYAVYKNKFNMGTLTEFELEFRTSELNGIILSVSEPEGYPALSLELLDGKVVMKGDMGDRRPFRMEQGLATEYAICDNRWHRIHATFIKDELTLRVDNLDQSYWLSDNGHLTEASTNSPLYIGGIPENASSGTLETREDFKGCMRNIIINGERKDWINMALLHHILLSSCPLVG